MKNKKIVLKELIFKNGFGDGNNFLCPLCRNEKERITNKIKLALINSGLINEDGWITTGTESSDFSDEFEQAITNIYNLFKELK